MSRKLPALNADNRAFWQGGEHGLLQIHKCNDCTRFFHPPGPICPHCASLEVAPCTVSGKGKVLSYTLNYQPWNSELEVPYVIAIIEQDEQAHVAAGSRWFRYACEARGLDPEPTFRQLVRRYMKSRLKKPFNAQARRDSGFSEVEVEDLMGMLG